MELICYSYNAAVFKIVRRYAYNITILEAQSPTLQTLKKDPHFIHLNSANWTEIYGEEHVSQYGNLYLGVDNVAFDASYDSSNTVFSLPQYLPRTIRSSDFAGFNPPSAEGWATFQYLSNVSNSSLPTMIQMSQGYTTNSGRESSIQINLYFMIVVLVCNLLKIIVMVYTLMNHRSDPLVTLGDAAASFLERPEPLTEGKCTLYRQELFDSYNDATSLDEGAKAVANDHPRRDGKWRPKFCKYSSAFGRETIWSARIS